MTRPFARPYVWMLCGCVVFTLMGGLAHDLGAACDWQLIAMARAGLPLAFAAVLALLSGTSFVFLTPGILWVRSIAGSLSMAATFYSLTRLPISDVFTLTNVFPIWVALLSWPLLGQRPTRAVWLCVFSGVAGVFLIQQPHFAEGNLACLAALAASVFTAFAMLGLHQLRGIDPLAIVVHFSAVALVVCTASWFVFDHNGTPTAFFTGGNLLRVLGVGVFATVGQVLLTKAFTWGSPTKVSVVGLTQIVFALLLDVLAFGQQVNLIRLAGMAMVLAPTAWVMTHRPGASEMHAEPPFHDPP